MRVAAIKAYSSSSNVILYCHFGCVSCFGSRLLDCVNALPLVATQRAAGSLSRPDASGELLGNIA